MANQKGIMSKDYTVTQKTLRGYTFNVKVYGDKDYAVFEDPLRGNVEVAKLVVPPHLRNDVRKHYSTWEKLLARVHRYLMVEYDQQKRAALFGIQNLNGLKLTQPEIRAAGDIKHATRNQDFLDLISK